MAGNGPPTPGAPLKSSLPDDVEGPHVVGIAAALHQSGSAAAVDAGMEAPHTVGMAAALYTEGGEAPHSRGEDARIAP